MMKKIGLVLGAVVILSGCGGLTLELEYFNYDNIPGVTSATTVEDIQKSVVMHVQYISDWDQWGKLEYWQTPDQTASMCQGDCEDSALLMMYLLKEYLNIDSQLIIGNWGDGWHAAVNPLHDDRPHLNEGNRLWGAGLIYDAVACVTWSPVDGVREIVNYDEAMMYAREYHTMPLKAFFDGQGKVIN